MSEIAMGVVPLKMPSSDMLTPCGQQMGDRIAVWVRRAGTTKEVARLFGVAVKTVEHWRAGRAPSPKHLWIMARVWGWPFIEDVFHPACADGDQDAVRQIARLKHDIAVLEGLIHDGTESVRNSEVAGDGPANSGHSSSAGKVALGASGVLVPLGRAATLGAFLFMFLAGWQSFSPAGDDWVRVHRTAHRVGPAVARILPKGSGV